MIIKNGRVFLPDGKFHICDIEFNERVEAIGEIAGEGLDAGGMYVIPGLVDIHSHGLMGMDFSDGLPGDIERMSRYYAALGVTSFLATTMTLKEPELTRAMTAVRDYEQGGGARLLGINLEGPFLSMAKRGAQNPDNLHAPDAEMFKRLNEASGGVIRVVTVAPEEPGAIEFIREVSKYCAVSLGHSDADYDTAMRGFEAGARHATHLFNGMPPLHHRSPGLIGAAFDSGAVVELIGDGLHVHPCVLRCAFSLFAGRLALISDSLRCAGMPEGEYDLGGLTVRLSGGEARLNDGNLAGSAISLAQALKNAVSFGIEPELAVAAATHIPARAIGMEGEAGVIAEGRAADIVLLDGDFSVQSVFVRGRKQ